MLINSENNIFILTIIVKMNTLHTITIYEQKTNTIKSFSFDVLK